jgi:hypothetical protein
VFLTSQENSNDIVRKTPISSRKNVTIPPFKGGPREKNVTTESVDLVPTRLRS